MDFKNETVKINAESLNSEMVRKTLETVYDALKVKGYDPINQLVAYIMSGDPTFITSYNNARVMISKIEIDELLDELVKNYIKTF